MADSVKHIRAPFDDETARSLRAGDRVLITGTILAARDAAHKRLTEALDRGEKLPVDLRGQVVYYVGPSPAKPGQAIGAAGPTTSGRMDAYTPRLIAEGLKGMIGKGYRKPEVVEAMKKYGVPYLAAVGGAGRASKSIPSSPIRISARRPWPPWKSRTSRPSSLSTAPETITTRPDRLPTGRSSTALFTGLQPFLQSKKEFT